MNDKKNSRNVIDTKNRSFLELVNTCNKYYNLIEKKLKNLNEQKFNKQNLNSETKKSNELCEKELEFWHELVIYKDSNDYSAINYIIGIYIRLKQLILNYLNTNKKNDCYFIYGLSINKKQEIAVLYNINIRLGDLNRYLKQTSLAKNYYLSARNLNPNNGQSYNQLALLANTEPIKCLYYYVRSYLSVEPSNIALNNINFSVKRFSLTNSVINLIFENNQDKKLAKINVENWFFVIIISIYANSVTKISSYFFDELNYWFKFKSNTENVKNDFDSKLLFPSLDILLDYYLHSNSTNSSSPDFEKSLLEFKDLILIYCNEKNFNFNIDCNIALKHDYTSLGLNFLQNVHSKLIFDKKLIVLNTNFEILVVRIYKKIENILNMIKGKSNHIKKPVKKMRNVALQSILGANTE